MENAKDRAYHRLHEMSKQKGYLLYDDIIDIVDDLDIDFDEIDRITEMLLMAGVKLAEDIDDIDNNEAESLLTGKIIDHSKIDYDNLYNRIERMYPEMTGVVECIRNIVPPQRGEFSSLIDDAQAGQQYAIHRISEMYARNILKLSFDDSEKFEEDFIELFSDYSLIFMESIGKFNTRRSSYSIVHYVMYVIKMRRLDSRKAKVDLPITVPPTTTMYVNRLYKYPEEIRDEVLSVMRNLMEIKNEIYLWRWYIREDQYICDVIEKVIGEEFSRPRWKSFLSYFDLEFVSYEELEENAYDTGVIDEHLLCDGDYELVYQKIAHNLLIDALDTLTERERKVLTLRFGLEDGRPRDLVEVGKEFYVTRERIRQIESKALRKLRHPSRARILKDFLD